MTHFVYLYREDGNDGLELRYSLRGLDRYFLADSLEVTIVGDLPSWAHRVHHVPVIDQPGNEYKVRNVVRKIVRAMDLLAGQHVDEAIILDDDHILLDYASSVMLQWVLPWRQQMQRLARFGTDKEWLKQAYLATDPIVSPLLTPRSFDIHRPVPVRPAQLQRILERYADRPPQSVPLWRTLWGNLQSTYPVHQGRDVRATNEFPLGTSWISTDQRYNLQKVLRVVDGFLPYASRWERS